MVLLIPGGNVFIQIGRFELARHGTWRGTLIEMFP